MKKLLLLLTFMLFFVSCFGKGFSVNGKSGETLPKFKLEKISGEKINSNNIDESIKIPPPLSLQ